MGTGVGLGRREVDSVSKKQVYKGNRTEHAVFPLFSLDLFTTLGGWPGIQMYLSMPGRISVIAGREMMGAGLICNGNGPMVMCFASVLIIIYK